MLNFARRRGYFFFLFLSFMYRYNMPMSMNTPVRTNTVRSSLCTNCKNVAAAAVSQIMAKIK